ncbi:hypothetical protein [Streptomyces aureus]|uniref:hypothetical protein n=1 Tax=Streptomyces aureus TaxID=193461 RepID=UPI001FD83774|nr:hypothetical protein [Streptomyces aureus]
MIYSKSRACLAVCAVAASVFLLASCTSSKGEGEAHSAPASQTVPSASPTATGASEKKLTEQVQAALATVHSGTMVEAGVERVSDGVHTEPALGEGRTYKLDLVCSGSGSARLTFVPTSAGKETEVPCDRSVVQQRITTRERVHIDVDGTQGSTGMVAWQIDAL